MTARGPSNRAFEHGLRTSFKKFGPRERQDPGRQFFYSRLMRVAFRHTYYNRSDDECPDFSIHPTRSSVALMNNLGLVFSDEGTGFTIGYDTRRTDSLLQYLRRQEWPEHSEHCWTRLSFVLSLKNPYFLNFTDVPLGINPVNKNFYFTNRSAHLESNGEILLNAGRQELLPVVPVTFGVDVDRKVKEVEVQSVQQTDEGSDETEICKPRCVPIRLLKGRNPDSITCREASECKGPKLDPLCRCTNRLFLNFSQLPEDKYTIKQVLYPSSTELPDEFSVLYTESYPMPFCFLSLFFTSPKGEKPKLFPVQDLFTDEPKIESISYELRFERRSTFWNYFIVPPAGESIEHLKINGEVGISFHGPCQVILPNQTKAYRFVSRKPLPLMEQSTFSFRLTGEIGHTNQNTTLMKRLPVASATQVLQDELSNCLRLSESIAPGARGECRKLQTQSCRCLCKDEPLRECLKRIKKICVDPQSPDCKKILRGCSRIYSDTYVYV